MRYIQKKHARKLIETVHDCEYSLRPYVEASKNKELIDHFNRMDKHFTKAARLMRLQWALGYTTEEV